jgi:DNA-directed RNA polymerase specialized sigma24 family protein
LARLPRFPFSPGRLYALSRSGNPMDAPKTSHPAPSLAGQLTADEFHRARRKALAYAKYRTRSNAKAEELVDDAIAASFDPEGSPWDRKTEPDFGRHLVKIICNKLPAMRRGEERRNDPGWQATAADELVSRPGNPEQKLDEAQQQSLAAEALDDATAALRAAGHDRPARVLELWRDEIDDAEEQARRLRCSVQEIHAARQVVRRYIRRRKTNEP